jgi:predicted nucleic acid-binding Zn ribbon protein
MPTVITCPGCGKAIDEVGLDVCPHCGGVLAGQEWVSYRPERGRAYRLIAIVILVVVGLSMLLVLLLTLLSQLQVV